MSQPATATGLLLCDDLIFTSRIVGTGRDLGVLIRPARTAAALLALAGLERPACIILDLGNPSLQAAEFMQEVGRRFHPPPRVIAYGSHVDAARLRAAREAGCDPVWPRSKFVEDLPQALPGWMVERPA